MRIETQLKKIEELEILFKSLFNRGLHTSHLLKIRQLAFTLILSSDTKKNLSAILAYSFKAFAVLLASKNEPKIQISG